MTTHTGQAQRPRSRQDDEHLVDNVLGQQVMGDFRPSDLIGTAGTMLGRGLRRPGAVASTTAKFLTDLGPVLVGTSERKPPRGDRRFVDPAWQKNPVYRRLLQGYLALSESLSEYAVRSGGTERERERSRFLLEQVGNAIAPTNFLLGNPTALKTAVETRGASLVRGGRNMLDDAWHRRPVPATVDESQFEVGDNLAVTLGEVVLRTEMFELIQYRPQTPTVYERPVLLIPSIVNKFYVFDLAPGRSVVEYMVQQGLTVFVLVWRNPQKRHDRWGMPEYQGAVDAGVQAALAITGADKVNLWAVCGAGPVVVSVAAHYASRGEQPINSLLLVVSPLDTDAMSAAPGIGAFMDSDRPAVPESVGKVAEPASAGGRRSERSHSGAIARRGREGSLDALLSVRNAASALLWGRVVGAQLRRQAQGRRMSTRDFTLLFAMLRSNEMIWSYWVSGYLLGKPPPAFDVLYWNADGTGMTARFNHDFSEFVEQNPFVTAGAMKVRGEPIADLAELGFDSYVLGAKTDHLCIWQGVHRSAQLLGESTQFVLGNAGHIQTIVSPIEGNPKASYSTGPSPTSGSPEEWLAASEVHPGSWWPHYVEWVGTRSGEQVAAPQSPGNDDHPPLCDAPGTYVHERV